MSRPPQSAEQRLLRGSPRRFRPHHQIRQIHCHHIFPQFAEGFFQLCAGQRSQIGKGMHLQPQKQRFLRPDMQAPASQRIERLPEILKIRPETAAFFLCPLPVLRQIGKRQQLDVAPRMGVEGIVKPRIFEEIQKLIISANFRVVAHRRHDPVNDAGNSDCSVIFQHAQALISLLNIEISQIFIANNGVADALVPLMRPAQRHPLHCEFRLAVQQRKKARRKSGNSPRAFHANDAFNGYFQRADILCALRNTVAQYLIQHHRERVLPLPLQHSTLLLSKPYRFQVFVFGLCHRHFDSSKILI